MGPHGTDMRPQFCRLFRVDDFSMALKRARAVVTRLEEEPRVNPSTGTMEFALRDPDGYYVMISAFSAAESSE